MNVKIWVVVVATAIALAPLTFYEQLGLTYIDNYVEDLIEDEFDNCSVLATSSTSVCTSARTSGVWEYYNEP